jgi:hypothetical protein
MLTGQDDPLATNVILPNLVVPVVEKVEVVVVSQTEVEEEEVVSVVDTIEMTMVVEMIVGMIAVTIVVMIGMTTETESGEMVNEIDCMMTEETAEIVHIKTGYPGFVWLVGRRLYGYNNCMYGVGKL